MIDPQLGPLADNGGPTQTFALLTGSPAIDAGSNPAALTSDQRGGNFFRVSGAAADIGAFELQPGGASSFVVNTLADENDGNYSPGHLSLREAVELANANPGDDTITFDPSLDGGTINLTQGELAITDSVTIEGPGAANLTINAGGNSRIFDVNDGNLTTNIDVEIDGLTLTGGNAAAATWPGNAGGAIYSSENLTLRGCTITGNTAANLGGGICINTTSVAATIIQDSVISGNTATADGGGIAMTIVNYSTLTIQDSTISGNTAGGNGGGVAASVSYYGAVSLQDSTVSGNQADGNGGGIQTATATSAATMLQDSTVTGNTAGQSGGGIAISTQGTGTTTIQNSTVVGNTAKLGGGVYSNNYGAAVLQNSTVTGNTASQSGGGVYSPTTPTPPMPTSQLLRSASRARSSPRTPTPRTPPPISPARLPSAIASWATTRAPA